ncbi:MAG: hypothetical protein E8D43_00600, partial [Nitrospira sp.]
MAEEIKRLNYFLGQFLEAEDFQAEQNYHVDMRRHGNHALYYTAGILDGGFQVTKVSVNKIQIGAGIGVDAQGRELVILSPVEKETTGFTGGLKAYVLIQYGENQADPKRNAEDGSNAEDGIKGYTRWMEAPKIDLHKDNLGLSESGTYITLALITLDANKGILNIDLSVRQHANARLPRNVTIGYGGDGVLNVRHVDGKHWENDSKDDLFLNWKTGKNVLLGFGENTKSSLFVSGDVGIGTSAAAHSLDVRGTSIKLGLEVRGGGQLIIGHGEPNDNKIYLEAFSADGTGHADELLLTGKWAANVPKLTFHADATSINGNLTVGGNITLAAGNQLNSPGRMHIAGEENLYLLNKGG